MDWILVVMGQFYGKQIFFLALSKLKAFADDKLNIT